MEKPASPVLTARNFYWLFAVVLSVNLLLWLDSFDRYLSSRYHFYLSQYLPEGAYLPSRALQQALNPEEPVVQVAALPQPEPASPAVEEPPGHGRPASAVLPASATLAAAAVVSAAASAPAVASVSAAKTESSVPGMLASASQVQPASAVVAELPASAPAASAPRVLFAGDSMMQGVAPFVISRMRKDYPGGVFVDLSRQSTGLTVNRYFDWPAKIKEESIKQNFNTVVLFLGPNDPWDIYEGKRRYAFPSDAWEKKYRARVDEVLDFASARGMRIIWIGLPAMRDERIHLGARIENRIFQEETRKYNFGYLPTEDFLGALDQPYQKFIEDPRKGKLVVRADDGIHFTSLGLRMISARVEQMIRKQENQ